MSKRGWNLGMARMVYSAAKPVSQHPSPTVSEGSLQWDERTIKLRERDQAKVAVCWVKDRDVGFTAQLRWGELHGIFVRVWW